MSEFISIVPVRAGSKGFKNKNLAEIDGLPLYLRTVKQALRITRKCILNTDIKEIIKKKDFDKEIFIYERDKTLAQDQSTMNEVLKDQFSKINLKDKIIILLQATSPLREDIDIFNAINLYKRERRTLVLSAKKVNNIYIKYGYQNKGSFIPFHKDFIFKNRQDLPEVYSPNGAIYIFSANDFLKNNTIPTNNIGFYEMSNENSIDIDDKSDLIKVKGILKIRDKYKS